MIRQKRLGLFFPPKTRGKLGQRAQTVVEERAALMSMPGFCADTPKRRLNARGVNIGLHLGERAGAGIPDHLRFQIVPRQPGDHNFITVLADIRAIPQHIERTFDQLLPDFQEYRP